MNAVFDFLRAVDEYVQTWRENPDGGITLSPSTVIAAETVAKLLPAAATELRATGYDASVAFTIAAKAERHTSFVLSPEEEGMLRAAAFIQVTDKWAEQDRAHAPQSADPNAGTGQQGGAENDPDTDDEPLHKLQKFASALDTELELDPKKRRRKKPEIRKQIRANHMELLKICQPSKSQDDGYPSDATIKRWIKDHKKRSD